jgi:hypothetical protein
MITLKNLNEASEQEVFDQVATHLLTQKKRSAVGEKCKYRTEDGLKCAAGCLMADDEYDPEIEGCEWYGALSLITYGGGRNHSALISDLQQIHDSIIPQDWFEELDYLASDYRFNKKVLDQFRK